MNNSFLDNLRYTGTSPRYSNDEYRSLNQIREENRKNAKEASVLRSLAGLYNLLFGGAGYVGDVTTMLPRIANSLINGDSFDYLKWTKIGSTKGSDELGDYIDEREEKMKETGDKAKEAQKEQTSRASSAQKEIAKKLDVTNFLKNLRSSLNQ